MDEMINKKFNYLTVVEYVGNKNHRKFYKCLCDCGKETRVSGTRLRNNETKSCGCLLRDIHESSSSKWIGKKFNRLTVLKYHNKEKNKDREFLCLCDCGNKKITTIAKLKKGHTKSCGCFRKEIASKRMTVHGLSSKELYKEWQSIKTRCTNSNSKAYKRYGERGIRISKEWENNPEKFISDIINKIGERPKGKTLDRIDNSKGYSVTNIKWSTPLEQAHNREHKKYWGVELKNSKYRVSLTREGEKRRSYFAFDDIEDAIKIRDQWLKEYEEDKEKWIEDTLNKTYDKGFSSQ